MKKLTDDKTLTGQSETISLTDLRVQPGEVFQQVQMGKSFTVTKCGKVIADISPPEPSAFELGAAVRKLGLAGNY